MTSFAPMRRRRMCRWKVGFSATPPWRCSSRSGLDFEALKKLAQTREFKPVTLPGVTLTASARVSHEVIVSKNILGRLPGATKPDETLIYSAHWDHFGVLPPDAQRQLTAS